MFETISVFWLIVAIVSGILEAVTVSLCSLWFMIGAVVAFLFSLFFPQGIILQILLFIVFSALSLFFIRPVAKKYVHDTTKKDKLNTKIGAVGIVVQKIDSEGKGRVRLGDVTWSAKCENGNIATGKDVIVKEVRGNTLYVELKEEA